MLQVVIRNVGQGPVVQPFWVDLYINPSSPPARVNQAWNMVGDQGLVWVVNATVLPLAPGASLTLTSGGQFFLPDYSRQSGPIQAGALLYVQVDSYNPNTNYGTVLESHEQTNGAYNNISSAAADASVSISASSQISLIVPHSTSHYTENLLPARRDYGTYTWLFWAAGVRGAIEIADGCVSPNAPEGFGEGEALPKNLLPTRIWR